MRGPEDIESYLQRMDATYDSVGDDVWVVRGITTNGPELVISIVRPVVVFRLKVTELSKVPRSKLEGVYRKLLELNVDEMLHGAYGIEGEAVVITAALPLENMDENEFQAVIDDIGLAVSNHYRTLSQLAA